MLAVRLRVRPDHSGIDLLPPGARRSREETLQSPRSRRARRHASDVCCREISMSLKIHFISGLPRSGSTVLAAILRQNPRFWARMTSPIAPLFGTLRSAMGARHDISVLIDSEQRQRLLGALFDAYYAHLSEKRVIFDTNRGWCNVIPTLVQLFPTAKFICCVRSPAWVLDSFERLVQRNSLLVSKMFNEEGAATVYGRVQALMHPEGGIVGFPLSCFRQAWFGEHANRMIAIRYETLARQPAATLSQVYNFLGEEAFPHDFDHLEYEEREFDARVGMPGLHRVSPRVEAQERKPILPPELFNQYDRAFWNVSDQNPRGVLVV